MGNLTWDRTLLAVGGVVVAVLVFLELWVEVTAAIVAYATAAMLISEQVSGQRQDQEGRRASTYSRSVSTSTSS
jgi:hypothetical protein